MATSHGIIRITGARQHNLKNITVELPKQSLTVITGVSGSGKSSLAFDTLYAEGQRRYVESLSTSAQAYLERLEKPDVDQIEGLSPAIAIGQHTGTNNPRSTIATVTEIYDYLRVLYATCGQPHDPETGAAIRRFTSQEIVETLLALPEGTKLMICAPLPDSETSQGAKLCDRLARQGFVRIRVNGVVRELEEKPDVSGKKTTVELVVDRLVVRPESQTRLLDSVLIALRWSGPSSTVLILVDDAGAWKERRFTTLYANPETGFRMPPLTPKHFSFNSHLGACPVCEGLGSTLSFDPDLVVPDPDKSLEDGALRTWWSKNAKLKAVQDRQIEGLAEHFSVDRKKPFRSLPQEFKDALFHGSGSTAVASRTKLKTVTKPFEGLAAQAERLLKESESEFMKQNIRRYMNPSRCSSCQGRRLKPAILGVTLTAVAAEGMAQTDMPWLEPGFSIDQFTRLTIYEAGQLVPLLVLEEKLRAACAEVLRELSSRLGFLQNVGLGYLSLDREYGSLSGGEAQRIRLATQLGSRLSGVLYVLDEPSIGLHQRDNDRLLATLRELRDLGNTVVVVEHDEDTMAAADWLIDMGPGAGPRGGEIIACGKPPAVMKNKSSLTGQYLSGSSIIPLPSRRVVPKDFKPGNDNGWLTVHGAQENNLKNIDVSFPLGCLVCVTGVSGSGKSTLVDDILRRELFRRLYYSKEAAGRHSSISGLTQIDKAVVIDQSAIGRSPRSNPATYVGAFTLIRDLYSKLPSSKVRGYTTGTFSFNTTGGRCEMCEGDGQIRIDMHFLSDAYITCDACAGKRYNREVLEVTFKGRNIAEVLEMTLDEAAEFFRTVPALGDKLRMMCRVGLGYLRLGQAANTLSGGEAQRIKLSGELSKRATGRAVYLLDEPTTGLHFADIDSLMKVLYGLRDGGNTLIVIEHNLDVIKCADWIIDMGPEGGSGGGLVLAEGPPDVIAACSASLTGHYLKSKLAPKRRL